MWKTISKRLGYVRNLAAFQYVHIQTPRFFSTSQVQQETHTFKAETQELLNIVAKSLYRDADVFIRELISNSSDALEKQRFNDLSNSVSQDKFQIEITTNWLNNQLIIQDNGIGMTKQELQENLGTIAKSGKNIIGQFGVGFYSTFIVAKEVVVVSKTQNCQSEYIWKCDGTDKFTIGEAETPSLNMPHGTKVTVILKEEFERFSKKESILPILQKYSSFINYPILVDGKPCNLVQAIWAKSKQDVSEEDYTMFYQHLTKDKQGFFTKLHYSTDVPLQIKCLLFIPNFHTERPGVGIEEIGVDLYCRKILIKNQCQELLPRWMRFVKGVIDCDDLPLNISRENYQDSSLIAKLRNLISKRVIKHIQEQVSTKAYDTWYANFNNFLKEGCATDIENRMDILSLLKYEHNQESGLISLEEYIQRIPKEQDTIYYLFAMNRQFALNSPYMEGMKDKHVLFLYTPIDEMLFKQIAKFKEKKFGSIENEDFSKSEEKSDMNEQQKQELVQWIQNELQPKIKQVRISKRLKDTPAIVTSEISSGIRFMMKMMENQLNLETHVLEVNINHPIIQGLNEIRQSERKLASEIIKQVLDSALIQAGGLEDVNNMLQRMNSFILELLKTKTKQK